MSTPKFGTIIVQARESSGTYVARAGSGIEAVTASCTVGAPEAAIAAAKKFFGCADKPYGEFVAAIEVVALPSQQLPGLKLKAETSAYQFRITHRQQGGAS